jgi:hypothetical protein
MFGNFYISISHGNYVSSMVLTAPLMNELSLRVVSDYIEF